MLTRLLKAKIHRATVTMTDVNYHGSITIDSDLLKATGLLPNEAVVVADCDNGARFETYIIPGKSGSGIIGINGAAARLSRRLCTARTNPRAADSPPPVRPVGRPGTGRAAKLDEGVKARLAIQARAAGSIDRAAPAVARGSRSLGGRP